MARRTRLDVEVRRPASRTDAAAVQEAVDLTGGHAGHSDAENYLHAEMLCAASAFTEGVDALQHEALLSAASSARQLAETAIRLYWVGRGASGGGAPAATARLARIEVADLEELKAADAAIRRTSGGVPFVLTTEDIDTRLAELGAHRSPPGVETMAREADWIEAYPSYRLFSSMVHAGINGVYARNRYQEEGGYGPFLRWWFAQYALLARNLLALFHPEAPSYDMPAANQLLAENGVGVRSKR